MKALTWSHAILRPILGPDPVVRRHTLFAMTPLATYLASAAMVWHLVYLNEMQAHIAGWLTLISAVVFFAFLITVRSGVTQSLPDPVLTFPHAVLSLVICAVAYALLGPHRANVLVLMAQSIVVAMLRLQPRRVLALGMLAALLLLASFAWVDWQNTEESMLSKGATHLVVGCASLLLLSLVGKWVSDIRLKIKQQAKDLRMALLTVRQLAMQDQLTGLLNRRYMLDRLEAERQLSERHGTHWCVALIDLDHFKRVNDRHGHPTGDAILKGFAELALTHLRGVDQVGRWGGEEFLVMFPQTLMSDALASLERLRNALNAWRLPDYPHLQMSFSAGLVQAEPEESLDQLVERADRTMYQAKAAGRNRSVWAPFVATGSLSTGAMPSSRPASPF